MFGLPLAIIVTMMLFTPGMLAGKVRWKGDESRIEEPLSVFVPLVEDQKNVPRSASENEERNLPRSRSAKTLSHWILFLKNQEPRRSQNIQLIKIFSRCK